MEPVSNGRPGSLALVNASRARAQRLAKLTCGVALTAALVGGVWVQPAAAQDDTITLTAGGSTLTVSPGNASAVSAVAEAHASPGYARVEAAAARAVADCEDGALAEGAAALAVAHPDEGALTESAAAEAVASNQSGNAALTDNAALNDNDALRMLEEMGVEVEGVKKDEPIRKVVEHKCHVDDKDKDYAPPVYEEVVPVEIVEVPSTGAGALGGNPLATLFAAASAAAAFGAVGASPRRAVALLRIGGR